MKIDLTLLESLKRAADGSMLSSRISLKQQMSRKERQLKNTANGINPCYQWALTIERNYFKSTGNKNI